MPWDLPEEVSPSVERFVKLRIVRNRLPELVPCNSRILSECIAEAVLPLEESRKLFEIDRAYRERGDGYIIPWFVLENFFTEDERDSATWLHPWTDRSFYQLAPDPDTVKGCPLCGIAEEVDLCAVVPSYKLTSDLIHASNNAYLIKPNLAARIAEESWSGFVMAPVFTAKKRRKQYLENLGLLNISTIVPLPAKVPLALQPLLLTRPQQAFEADLWTFVPTEFGAQFGKDAPVGIDPVTKTTRVHTPPPCGHIVGFRKLGPLKISWNTEFPGDATFTSDATGQPKGTSLFRPAREMIVSRRLANIFLESTTPWFDFQPLLN